ncbi:uncharacterized protein [Leptinotarsa decemlineata]|uniref:uncharacterized protein n=1 Tax=Leptinotarsa decemlineata TaxID=7539 RepID=UPI003D3087BC
MSRGKYLVSLATDNRTEVLAQDLTTPDSRTLANEVQNKEEIDEPIIIQTTTTEAFSYETASYHRELLQTSAKNAQNDEEIGEITGYSDDSIVDPNYQQSESSEDNTSCEANEHENMNNEIICTRKKRRLRKNSERRERDKNSHQLRSPCACKKRCVEKINEQRRVAIWNEFYKMDYNTRRSWVHGRIEQKGKARSTTKVEVRKRSRSLMYTLPDENAHSQTICKKFFLRTLGYDEKNDKFITTVFKNLAPDSITPNRDRRGLAAPKNKCNREILQQHISSFHPCISHYRREHAPNRLYLPHDITIRSMHADYLQKFPQNKISYYTYRKVVSDMNISFTKLGNEECDHCMMQIQHIKSHNEATATVVEVDENLKNAEGSNEYETTHRNSTGKTATTDLNLSALESSTTKFRASCTTCMKWLQHIEFAKLRRVEYRKDVARKKIETEAVRSVDLQKVIMLPRIPASQKTFFTRRIVVFHLTFASMTDVKSRDVKKNIAVLWHEAVAGRKKEEIASAYYKALVEERDYLKVMYWTDNCSAQNKNWCLYTMFVTIINSNVIAASEITIKYFEAGHTFMSADSVHHGVEQSMKTTNKGNIYDFNDFVKAVENSNGRKMNAICLTNDDVLNWKPGDSKAKSKQKDRPLLCDISVVQFRRGSRLLFYKNNIDDEKFKEYNFLKVNFKLEIPNKLRDNSRGVSTRKKQGIISQLCPLMPENRRQFWLSLREADVEDLIDNDD